MKTQNIFLLLLILAVVAGGVYYFLNKQSVVPAVIDSEIKPEMKQDNNYIGITTEAAEAKAKADGVPFRVVKEDGQPKPTTRDFSEGRINATVEKGIVMDFEIETSNPTPAELEEPERLEQNNHDTIIGMTTAEAEAYAKVKAVDYRVGILDGKGLPVTMDLRPGRITAEVEKGLVVGYTVE